MGYMYYSTLENEPHGRAEADALMSKRAIDDEDCGSSSRQKVQERGPPKLGDIVSDDFFDNPAPGDPLPPAQVGPPVPFKLEVGGRRQTEDPAPKSLSSKATRVRRSSRLQPAR